MKVLLSWLREFAPLEGAPEELADDLSDLGLAVEGMARVGEGLEGVAVARVLDLRAHPDADRIQLVDVDAGDGQARQICCGAFNMHVGDLVPLATVGTVLPNGMEIGRRKLRGQISEGMLCAPDELGLGGDHTGIMVLPTSAEPGTPLAEALGIEPDVLFDLEVNPNRPDALSVAGVARDLAARRGTPFAIADPVIEEAGDPVGAQASVEILAPDLCGRFLVRVIRDVPTGASAPLVANRLRLVGMRPIDRVVDVSNYVMVELGQPNHTYDLDLVPGGHLGTRWARAGERLLTLDGVERALEPGDGVIVDREDRAIGLAGVMGGASTEISDQTRHVLLEMAWWDPMAVARTSSRLGLRSEASIRFERGSDPEIIDLAARRFCALLGGGSVAPGTVDQRGELPPRPAVRVRTDRVNRLLGTELAAGRIAALLEPIGFEVAAEDGDLAVVVPSFRPDTRTETDVVEEVARHHGYSAIERTVPRSGLTGGLTPRQRERREVREVLVGMGLSEAMPLPFLAPADLERAGIDLAPVSLTNPLDANESVLRPSLLPGLLKALAYNASHRNPDVGLFELGRVFRRPAEGADLPEEPEHLAVALGGNDAREASRVWQVLARALNLPGFRLEPARLAALHPGRGARVLVAGEEVGLVGEVDPDVAARFEVPGRAGWVEVDLDRLLALPHGERRYRPVSRYPSSDIDLAFEVDEAASAGDVESTIWEAGGDLLVAASLFDVFRGEQVGPGRRSLAFALRLQAPDRTLTDEEVAEVRGRIIAAVEDAHPARLRGG